MKECTVKVDRRGRILIPRGLRERIGLKEGGYARLVVSAGGS